MRLGRSVPRLAPVVCLTVCLTGCGAVDGGVRVEGAAVTSVPWTGPVYMTDWYGRAWQQPEQVEASLHLSLDGLKWRNWGSPRPSATGVATDTDCISGCADVDHPPSYRVNVVLSALVRRGDVAYYSHASVTPRNPPAPFWAEGHESTELDVPAK